MSTLSADVSVFIPDDVSSDMRPIVSAFAKVKSSLRSNLSRKFLSATPHISLSRMRESVIVPKSHVFVNVLKAFANCSIDSPTFCDLVKNLCRSKVSFFLGLQYASNLVRIFASSNLQERSYLLDQV